MINRRNFLIGSAAVGASLLGSNTLADKIMGVEYFGGGSGGSMAQYSGPYMGTTMTLIGSDGGKKVTPSFSFFDAEVRVNGYLLKKGEDYTLTPYLYGDARYMQTVNLSDSLQVGDKLTITRITNYERI